MTSIGIHDIAMATTKYRLDLPLLAEAQGIDPEKYRIGIGQDSMSFPAADEDIVTLAAAAAQPIIERHGVEGIRTVLLATETGIDQSKAAAVYVHALLGLPHSARAVELTGAIVNDGVLERLDEVTKVNSGTQTPDGARRAIEAALAASQQETVSKDAGQP